MSGSDDFVKVYGSILDSSIWLEPSDTRVLWLTMLAMAANSSDGVVVASVKGLAARARIPPEACRVGLDLFLSPDPDSKNPDNEGRRIEKVEGGWRILNHQAYLDRRSKAQRQTAARVQRHRERQTKERTARRPTFDPLSVPIPPELSGPTFAAAWAEFCAYRKQRGKPFVTEDGPRGAFRHLLPLGPERAIEALRLTRENQWQSVEYGVKHLLELEAAAPGAQATLTPHQKGRKVAQDLEMRRREIVQRAFARADLTREQRDSITEAANNATCLEDLARILWPS